MPDSKSTVGVLRRCLNGNQGQTFARTRMVLPGGRARSNVIDGEDRNSYPSGTRTLASSRAFVAPIAIRPLPQTMTADRSAASRRTRTQKHARQ